MFEWLWQEGVLPPLFCIVNCMSIGPSKHIGAKSSRVSHHRWNWRFNRLTICCIFRIFWTGPQHALDRFRLHAIKMKCKLTLEWLRYYFSGNPSQCRKKSTFDCSRTEQGCRCKDINKFFADWFSIFNKKISSIILITKTILWTYGNVFACNVAFVQLSSRITKNSQEIWKNDEKRHLTKSSYSLQMKLKTGLSLKNTNF